MITPNIIARITLATLLLPALLAGCGDNQNTQKQDSDYAGQQVRDIKAMTAEEVRGYLEGEGMGLSLVAELNHYPGPRHVLDLATELELTEAQLTQAEALFDRMKNRAVALGERYVAAERELNDLFENGGATSSKVDSLLTAIGGLQGQLRAVHVKAHIQMKEILSPQQITRYDQIRGYTGEGEEDASHEHHRP
ncbi:MAG: periplasmic heavy metal sensor [Balneolaceae bacterium]|nr:periplasmic heavy metal sensor [Balneolaceae bacterium]